MTSLDVLLLESGPGDGADDARRLEEAGHRVHRCFDAHGAVGTTHPSGWVPCRALTDGSCPLDAEIDVVLLARRGVAPRPGPREAGVRCAVRAGVPIVEDGGDVLDPFAPWISGRTDRAGVVAACEAAAAEAMAPVVRRLREGSRVLLATHGVDPSEIDLAFVIDGDGLVIHITGPPLPPAAGRALSDRARDAVGAVRRTFRTIDVGYRPDSGPASRGVGT
jgi:hypothetical protein